MMLLPEVECPLTCFRNLIELGSKDTASPYKKYKIKETTNVWSNFNYYGKPTFKNWHVHFAMWFLFITVCRQIKSLLKLEQPEVEFAKVHEYDKSH